MKKDKPSTAESKELRRRAEARLRDSKKRSQADLPEADTRRLVHELEVHQIELEMQNEELRAARANLEEGLARYTEIFDFAPIGYAAVSEGKIREINHAGALLLGNHRSHLVGHAFKDFVAPGDRAAFAAMLAQTADETKAVCEISLVAGGAMQNLRLTATQVAGRPPKLLLALEDITDRKAREEQLVRTEALREADRRKDEFLAVLSHELRNPLAPIRNSLFILERAAPGSQQALQAQLVIERQVSHLTRLVSDLLDVNRIRTGKVRLRLERVELGDLVRRAMDDHRTSFEASGKLLEGRFDPGLFWVKADPARMIQVLSNALGNADKFTPRGGSVVVSLQRQGEWASLRVRDTGSGISAAFLPHVFEPFAQAPQPNDRNPGGLGLGLAMVKGIVDLHDGTVAINSEGLGQGTELTVTLALALEKSSMLPAGGSSSPPATNHRRVLLIEDNADAANSLAEALILIGHVVETAYDGPTGIELARSYRPEVAICDIGLPGMDGYAVARAFRRDDDLQQVYLVALTGYAQPEDIQRAIDAGFDQHIGKPTRLEALNRILARAPSVVDADQSPDPSR